MAERPSISSYLDTLSDEETLKIFRYASNGLKSGREGLQQLQITRKQFYSRLGRLVDLGLIVKKDDGIYEHTALGGLINNTQIKPLEEALANYWTLHAVDELKQAKEIPQLEQEKLIAALMVNSPLKVHFTLSNRLPTKIITSYDELVDRLLNLVELAKNEIYLASRY